MRQFSGATAVSCIALFLLISQHSLVSAGSSLRVLDQSGPLDVESIARVLCEVTASRDKQISRLSTVEKLAEFFEQQVSDEKHALFKCKQQHGEALRLLQGVLSSSIENVCSTTKMALIEDFHNQFVSTHVDHEKMRQEAQHEVAPQLLRLFFMHYAMEVDAWCKRNLINNLEWDLKEKFGDDINEKLFELDTAGQEDQATFGAIFKGAMKKFTDLYSVEKYEDVLMVWDLIENSYLNQKMDAEAESIRDEFDPITGEPVRLLVRVKTASYLNKIKEHCHYSFKPIYSKLILPIIKMADLGYSNNGEQFKKELEELRTNEQVKRWYSVTQLCEAMLPVKYYEDPEMVAQDVVVLTKSQAKALDEAAGVADQLSAAEPMTRLVYEPDTNSMEGLDRLESVTSLEAQKLVKDVRSNLSVRDRVIGRTVIQLVRNLKNSFKTSRVGRFFFAKPTGNQGQLAHPKSGGRTEEFEEQEIGQPLSKSLQSMSDQDILRLDGSSGSRMFQAKDKSGAIGRRRRYRRKGDVDIIQEMRSDALSYTRTKSWSEIFAGWGDVLSAITPSRTKLIIVGSVIVGLLTIVAMGTITAAAFAALG